ncbi:MAG: beta-lactamase family protein [Pyrinomonadaceae bacterium]|nr:beta-lactamase family protein [Pyrinomonadaceae bacterium]
MKTRFLFCMAASLFAASYAVLAQVPDRSRVVAGAERAFEKASKTNAMPAPGCAIGVSVNGESVFEKAFGLAEMEHNIPNTPQTIFESGSVAKQFTAAALVLLQQEGKLSIDDPVRKYIPELPDYGSPLTIRHLLNHTAGLRDWGAVMSLTGAGRGDRVISQALAVDVILRQKYVDFKPGSEYSYTNSGYQLAAEIVERVSKQKFPAFVGERIFKPLGMTNSSTRDNYQRIVPGRAQAYSRQGANGSWELNMPFMNVYGNGGMLTTVGDWLKWNAMLDDRTWNPSLVDALETQGVLNDGYKIQYALGLTVGKYKGLRDVSHGGSTAGYQTFLARYPDQKLSVAVLCNGTSPNAGGIAASVTDEILGPFPEGPKPPAAISVPEEQLKKFVGIWRNDKTHLPARITFENGALRFAGQPMRPIAEGTFLIGGDEVKFTYDKDGRPIAGEGRGPSGVITRFVAEREWTPTAAELTEFVGEWYSDEAQAKVAFSIEDGKAFIVNKPVIRLPLQPLYKDHFLSQGYVIWFTRDQKGKIERMHVGAGRMRDMFFEPVR